MTRKVGDTITISIMPAALAIIPSAIRHRRRSSFVEYRELQSSANAVIAVLPSHLRSGARSAAFPLQFPASASCAKRAPARKREAQRELFRELQELYFRNSRGAGRQVSKSARIVGRLTLSRPSSNIKAHKYFTSGRDGIFLANENCSSGIVITGNKKKRERERE